MKKHNDIIKKKFNIEKEYNEIDATTVEGHVKRRELRAFIDALNWVLNPETDNDKN